MRYGISLLVALIVTAFGADPSSAQIVGRSSAATSVQRDQRTTSATSAFPSDARLAYVDVDRVAALSMEGKAAAARLEELRTKKAAELSARGKQVQALQSKLSQSSSVLTDLARRRLEREFQRAQVDFQRFTQDAQEEVRELQQELMQAFTARLFPVIDTLAREKNLWAVFSSESVLLWYHPALDVSEEVAKRLDSTATPAR